MDEQDAKELVKIFFAALFRDDRNHLEKIFDNSRVSVDDFYRIMKENNLAPGRVDDLFDKKNRLAGVRSKYHIGMVSNSTIYRRKRRRDGFLCVLFYRRKNWQD